MSNMQVWSEEVGINIRRVPKTIFIMFNKVIGMCCMQKLFKNMVLSARGKHLKPGARGPPRRIFIHKSAQKQEMQPIHKLCAKHT